MLVLALTAALALSAPGTLDRSFGHDGRVVTSTSGVPAVAGIESVGGGKVVLAGTVGHRALVLIRYRRDGSLDRRFGHKGVSTIRFDRYVTARDTLLDSAGRLLVAGSLGEFGTPHRDALLLRFDRAGHLDPTLDQDGIALTDFGGSHGDGADAIARAPDGSIVLAASVDRDEPRDLGVARLDSSGTLDHTFGSNGFVRMAPHDSVDNLLPAAAAVAPDGRIEIAVNYSGPRGGSPFLLSLLPDGTRDPAFGIYGRFFAGGDSSVDDLVLQAPTGRLFFAGFGDLGARQQTYGPWVAAMDRNSQTPAWTTKFGVPGVDSSYVWGSRLALDSHGRPVAAGGAEWWLASKKGRLYPQIHRADVIVTRVGAAGKLDRCFGKRGVARIRFPGKLSTATAITIGSHDTITVAGPPQFGDDVPHRFELARLRGGNCTKR
jgi:uncharacterized delta-60 repeat protein